MRIKHWLNLNNTCNLNGVGSLASYLHKWGKMVRKIDPSVFVIKFYFIGDCSITIKLGR